MKKNTDQLCIKCNKRKVTYHKYRDTIYYDKTCANCRRKEKYGLLATQSNYKYIKYKKEICEKCNFIPEHSCQLDVDHIDGNRNNNNPSNLQTLCANCHRLKTFNNKEYLNDTNNKYEIEGDKNVSMDN
jgi:hypothetical protein